VLAGLSWRGPQLDRVKNLTVNRWKSGDCPKVNCPPLSRRSRILRCRSRWGKEGNRDDKAVAAIEDRGRAMGAIAAFPDDTWTGFGLTRDNCAKYCRASITKRAIRMERAETVAAAVVVAATGFRAATANCTFPPS